jgi:Ion channel
MTLAITISLILVFTTVLVHYEGLRLVSRGLHVSGARHDRRKVLLAIFWIFLIHILEIGIYAVGIWIADDVFDIGSFAGAREAGMFDYFYFSAESFSTLGLGDLYPVGPLRLLASIEPINGLLLIGWSTSFTFLGMQRYWFFDEVRG